MPLVVVVTFPNVSTATTVAVYALGLIVDLIVALAALAITLRYSARASRGELFAIPLITPLVDRLFPVSRGR